MKIFARVLAAIFALIGVAGQLCINIFNAKMIIAFGAPALIAVSVASYIAIGLGVTLFGVSFVSPIMASFKNKRLESVYEKKKLISGHLVEEYSKDSLNPELTRKRLDVLTQNNSNLIPLVTRITAQMDKMDEYQSRQRALIDANDAVYLEDTVAILDESERRMCHNIRNIINCCILVETDNASIDDIDNETIDNAFTNNEAELKSVKELLKYSVNYINDYDMKGISDRSELDSWIKVMKRNHNKENELRMEEI